MNLLTSIFIAYKIITGYQQTILPSNKSSFESQSLLKVVIAYRHTLLSSTTESIKSQPLNQSFPVVPETSFSSSIGRRLQFWCFRFRLQRMKMLLLKIDPGNSYSSILYYADNGNSFTNVIEPFSNKFMSRMHFYYLDLTSLEISSLPIIHHSFNNPTYSIFISIYMITGCVVIWIILISTVDLIMDLLQ